jgi:hypothetical protein
MSLSPPPQVTFESLNMVCISRYLNPSQWRTSLISSISNTNITASQIAEKSCGGNNVVWRLRKEVIIRNRNVLLQFFKNPPVEEREISLKYIYFLILSSLTFGNQFEINNSVVKNVSFAALHMNLFHERIFQSLRHIYWRCSFFPTAGHWQWRTHSFCDFPFKMER